MVGLTRHHHSVSTRHNIMGHMMMTSKDNTDILDEQEDDIYLGKMAHQSRLPPDQMTPQEIACLPDVACASQATVKVFLYIRNKILQLWFGSVMDELTYARVLQEIPPPFNSDVALIKRLHAYLDRWGFINFGVYKIAKPIVSKEKTVIVIGAGMAGLTAARKLTSFGCKVIIVEARKRIGGRIATYRKESFLADLGAMVVTGLSGNPLTILAKQLPISLCKVKMKCPLYDHTGKPVENEKDEIIEREFNRLLEAAAYLAHTLQLSHIHGHTLTLGSALELVLKQQEKRIKLRKLEYWQTILDLQEKLQLTQDKMLKIKEHMKSVVEELGGMGNEGDENDVVHLFHVRSKKRDLGTAAKEYTQLKKNRTELEDSIREMRASQPSDVYMSTVDRQLLDWHMANLEFANATALDNLSLKYWDQDDDFEFGGSHLTVKEGYGIIPQKLAEGLDIRCRHVVKQINYSPSINGVVVSVRNDKGEEELQGDAVLCTTPLGVLKQSIIKCDDQGSMNFNPPLPEWKTKAIHRLGFGNLNKVILCYDRVFWDASTHLFGQVNQSSKARGEFYMFWAVAQAPVLIAVVAGNAAEELEKQTDNIVIARCNKLLQHIFGQTQVPQPRETVVTRWRSDPYARGSYSYVGADATGDDYDTLGTPIGKLFFGGEHTQRNYPATVHGAMLSGLREAGRIAENHLGCPYAPAV